ncbi:hypothetical protein [Mycobacterium sp. 236(2023)]|uniref:hypothetical protein n=1 Tax=Mycobacterium sp. 236(2023) TaxID=3038163 RepID=UPI0024154AB1|nr:hypothetical protein [Mycobacterium sp. 236(2023)]MDG4665212.1 hypothetical protein [Mycobacterium sp. 236(2023)]
MRSPVRPILLAVAVGGIGVFTGYWSVAWALRGSYVTALIMLAVAIWGLGFAAFYLCTALGAATPRTDSSSAGTLLRPGLFVDIVTVVPIAAITIAAAMYLVLSPFGLVDYSPSGIARGIPLIFVAFLVLGVTTLYRMVKHKGGGHLRLDPAGFEVWNSHWNSFRGGTWDEIEQILDHKPNGGKPFNKLVVFVPSKGANAVLYSDAITSDSDALLTWIRFYWEHPEYRDELVDDRGLQRLSDEKFTPER